MLFGKKIVSIESFCNDFLWPCLDNISADCTSEIIENLKSEPFEVSINSDEIGIEVGIFIHHIAGKLVGQIKEFENPYTPEAIIFGQQMLEHFYTLWGQGTDHDKYIVKIKNKYMDKVKVYEKWETAYSRSEMTLEDFEACITVNLLGVKYQELPRSFVKVMGELHKGSTVIIAETIKTFTKKYKISPGAIKIDGGGR